MGVLAIEINGSLFAYTSRLEVEGESATICLISYPPPLNIARAIAQKLCDGLTQAGQPSNLMSSHGTSCPPQWGPCPASWPCHSPACVSSWKWGPAFATLLRTSSHGFAFPSRSKNILRDFREYWKPLELLGTKAAVSFPQPRCQGKFIISALPPSQKFLLERKVGKGPKQLLQRLFTDWQPQVFITCKLSLWNHAVTKNNPSGCLSICFSFWGAWQVCVTL